MDPSVLQAAWAYGGGQVMESWGQPTLWNTKPVNAIVDSLSFATTLRRKGGGLIEEFSGSVVYLKTAFIPGQWPAPGQRIIIPAWNGAPQRIIEIAAIEGQLDHTDPFLTCLYEPIVKP